MDNQKNIFIITGSIIIAGIIIGVAVLYGGAQRAKDQEANIVESLPLPPTEEDIVPDVIEIESEGHTFIGEDDAPITIIGISDFECPFCNRFAIDTLPEIKEKYIDEGIVKFVFRDFPLPYHPFAQKAAEASLCVYDQEGRDYYAYHMALHENSTALEIDDLKEYAEEIDVDMDEFEECLDTGKFETVVQEDFEEINKIIQDSNLDNFGTPAFFVNGKPLIGAQPLSAFDDIIEEELLELE
jgi:protein-disulfide isomerase